MFESFCQDPVSHVRQSVLFALPAILSRLPSSRKRTQTLKTIMTLSRDPSAAVRSGVLEVLGEVIYTFCDDEMGPPNEIVRLFIGDEGRDWSFGYGSQILNSSGALSLPQNNQTRQRRQLLRTNLPLSPSTNLRRPNAALHSPHNCTPIRRRKRLDKHNNAFHHFRSHNIIVTPDQIAPYAHKILTGVRGSYNARYLTYTSR